MPIVYNPTQFNLTCGPADDQEILAGGKIRVSDEVAAKVSTVVFVILEDEEPKPPAKRRVAKAQDPSVETR